MKLDVVKIGQLLKLELKGLGSVQGILINVGDKCTILKFVPCDFIIDGYVVVNNRHITNYTYETEKSVKAEILRLKKIIIEEPFNFDLSNSRVLFESLAEGDSLVQIFKGDKSISYIGKVIKVNKKSFRFRMLSTNGEWLKDFPFKFKSIRSIHLQNDYLDSFNLFLKRDGSASK